MTQGSATRPCCGRRGAALLLARRPAMARAVGWGPRRAIPPASEVQPAAKGKKGAAATLQPQWQLERRITQVGSQTPYKFEPRESPPGERRRIT